MKLNSNHKQAIQLLILDRHKPSDVSRNIANHLGVNVQTVGEWRRNEDFCKEYKRQLDIYKKNFDDVKLADRKERVKELDRLYHKIPDARVALKVRLLDAIAREMGDVNDSVVHKHMIQRAGEAEGVNAPPQANNYEEWLAQNKQMEEMRVLQKSNEAVEAEFTEEKVHNGA